MSQHIGIAAVSPEGGSLCYRQVLRHAQRLMDPSTHPTITLHNIRFGDYLKAVVDEDWHEVGRLLRQSGEVLAEAGADFCICPDNAVLHAVHLAAHVSSVPWLCVTDCVADALERDERRSVGLLGSRAVTRGAAYQTKLGMRGIKAVAPPDEEAMALDEIIYRELATGRVLPESLELMARVIHSYRDRGCDGVVLAYSESALIDTSLLTGLPVYDAADILAECALRRAAGPGAELGDMADVVVRPGFGRGSSQAAG